MVKKTKNLSGEEFLKVLRVASITDGITQALNSFDFLIHWGLAHLEFFVFLVVTVGSQLFIQNIYKFTDGVPDVEGGKGGMGE